MIISSSHITFIFFCLVVLAAVIYAGFKRHPE